MVERSTSSFSIVPIFPSAERKGNAAGRSPDCRVGINRIEPDFVFLDVRIMQGLVIVQMPVISRRGSRPFSEGDGSQDKFVLFQRFRLNEGAEVLELLRPLVSRASRPKR